MLNSLFSDGDVSSLDVLCCIVAALISGIIFSFMCYYKSKSTKSFLIATSMLPAVVALVIILVNGNVGAGVAIAGAFSLVRFRSAPGTAKEICIIFISMAAGLAFGMGFIAYGIIFLIFMGIILMLLNTLNIWNEKVDIKEKRIKVVIPEELDYSSIFDDIFYKYTNKAELVKVKTINMGSMFSVYYDISIKDLKLEKQMVDEIRCRNGNLEVSVQRIDYVKSEL